MRCRLLSILLIAFGLIGCNNENRTFLNFIGSEIEIPSTLQTIGSDTLHGALKIIVFYDTMQCTPCQISRQSEWLDFMDCMTAKNVEIEFIFDTRRNENIDNLLLSLKRTGVKYPVRMDINGDFVKANPHLPKNSKFHTFLLDRYNRVTLIGSPLYNSPLWKLYETTIDSLLSMR